jgi:molybdopterin-guanine dinucleotide biosynthesis protein B
VRRHGLIFGVVGWSGSGKTTLVEKLIPRLVARGLAVSTVKHAHHAFEPDTPGKDSHRHRVAGAREVLVMGGQRWALIHEHGADSEPPFEELLAQMQPADIVLVEGFKTHPHAKLEVWAQGVRGEPWHRTDPTVVAVASDDLADAEGLPLFRRDDVEAVAAFIVASRGGA